MRTSISSLECASDSGQFGRKATGLHWLTTQGILTAPGVVISIDALHEHLVSAKACHELKQLHSSSQNTSVENLTSSCLHIQKLITATPISSGLLQKLQIALAQVVSEPASTKWVVRSSAVAEDGPANSFAGQFESVLNVQSSQELESAIVRVWASTFRVSAWRYGLQRGVLPSQMAVIVQQQVDASLSGVLFTCDPAAGDSKAIRVEYCAGLSDELVSGLITPVSKTIPRNSAHLTSRDKRGQGISTALDQQFELVREELCKASLKLEAAAGKPQDIEWCVNREQQLHLVQARPITVVQAPPLEYWTNANIGENFPGPVVPLLASFVPRGYAAYFRGLGTVMGVSNERIEAAHDSLQQLVGVQAGRLYYNLSQIVTVLHAIPGGAWLSQAFNTFTGTTGSPKPTTKRWSRLSQLRQALVVLVRLPFIVRRIESGVSDFENNVDAYANRSNPNRLATLTMHELGALLDEFLSIRLQRWTPAALADAAAMVSYAALQQLLNRWLPDANQSQLHNALLQGLPSIITTAPVEALWELAVKAKANDSLAVFIQSNTSAHVWKQLQEVSPEFFAEFVHYLDTWGFRYSGELMLTQATPAENPLPVIKLLQTYLADAGLGPEHRSAQSAQARLVATLEIEAQLTPSTLLRSAPLPTRAFIFRVVLKSAQASICLRERARMKQALLYTRLRHISLALGDQLMRDNVIADRESVFFLTIDEAIAIAQSTVGKQTQHALISQRRAEFERCEKLHPPDQMQLPIGSSWVPKQVHGSDVNEINGDMTGLGACTGTVTGQACVVLDVTDIDVVAKDTVLVTQQTDPGWAPVFFLIKGLVVERGGMLSHGAIIAREYGIPAVVGVTNATNRIRNGDQLTVDGNQGRVTWML